MLAHQATRARDSASRKALKKLLQDVIRSAFLLPVSMSTPELLPETLRSGSPCPTLQLLAVGCRGASGGFSMCGTASPSGLSTSLSSKLGGSAVPARGDVSSELHHTRCSPAKRRTSKYTADQPANCFQQRRGWNHRPIFEVVSFADHM